MPCCEGSPKWRSKQRSRIASSSLSSCERSPKWRSKQLVFSGALGTPVAKGRRNGGLNNASGQTTSPRTRCEGSPKWRSKQLSTFAQHRPSSCEGSPKWRSKQRLISNLWILICCEGSPKWRSKQPSARASRISQRLRRVAEMAV